MISLGGYTMKANVGSVDRIIRIVIGIIILAVGFQYRSWWGLIGIVPLATGIVGFCGLYTVFGISTCPLEKSKETSDN